MTSHEIRQRFLTFFKAREHAVLSSAPLVPDDTTETDSTLFNSAGMQPLIPYLLGKEHPEGKRLASVQQCVRTTDLEEVGDTTHATFFEMLGNWSLGDYFKEDAIAWSYAFLTDPDEGLGLDPNRIYCTVYSGDEVVPKDTEAYSIWTNYIAEDRIYFMDAKTNWWSAGADGPCGPDTEMFYDVRGDLGTLSRDEFIAADERGDLVEIWNDVFMEYRQENNVVVGKLTQRNVDTGAGLERLAAIMQGKPSIFETDLFAPLIDKIRKEADADSDVRAERIIADHVKAATWIIASGIRPAATGRGYVLRRMIRRAIRYAKQIGVTEDILLSLIPIVIELYEKQYPEIRQIEQTITDVFNQEATQFYHVLVRGLREIEKIDVSTISGEFLFDMYQSFGFPPEMTIEEVRKRGGVIDNTDELLTAFYAHMKEHQSRSKTADAGAFKGGLADTSEASTRYHTATHLLHQALREVLGNHVLQKGSNITPKRLRFDFSHPEKLTDEEIQRVEEMVNEKIREDLPVISDEVSLEEARNRGALGVFDDTYGETVSVYQIGTGADMFSLEICGGPHVSRTGELGTFRITKEQASAKGVRRIKAVLE